MKKILTSFLTAWLFLPGVASTVSAAALDSGFSYQGRLFDGGVPAGGSYDMVFALRDRATEGALVGAEQALDAVVVTNGLFQVTLDFGTNVWDASALWLDVSVRSNGTQTTFTLLTPSQQIRAVPYAVHAIKAGELVGNLPGTQLSGSYPNAVSMVNSGNAFAGSGAGLTALNGSQVTSGTIADARIDSALARDSELLSVSNALSGQIGSQSSALTGTITTTSNGLSDRLIATNGVLVTLVTDSSNGLSGRLISTNAALVSLVTTTSNGLQSGIDAEGTARAALVTKLETGNNSFAGSNHFSGIATLTNVNNVLAGNGSGLTALNGSQITSGTVADARIDSALARDSELLSVSNALSGQIGSQSSALTGTITTTSNGLSDRLIATNGALVTLVTDSSNGLSGRLVSTNAALVSLVTTTSNGLQSGIDAEGTARAALVTKLETGNNTFAGSNHFSGIVTLTNATNKLAGDGSALTALNASQLTSGTISVARLPAGVVIDQSEVGAVFQGNVNAASFNGDGSALTALNGSQVTSGTVADARIDSTLARDSELLSVSNALSGQIGSQSSALTGTITTTSNGLSDRLIATNGVLVTLVTDSSNGLSGRLVSTNAALVSLVTTSSNGLQSGIDAEGTARAALVTKLETGNNTFAGSNHFSGIATLTNVNNVLAGNGSGLTALNGSQITSGTVADARIDSTLARDSELLSVSNALSGQIGSQSSALTGTITTTSNSLSDRLIATNGVLVTLVTDSSNGLSGRLVSTNAALVSLVTTTSNGLQSGIDAEGTARAALVTKLETGNNSFAGSNHFSGIATLTNVNNVLAGNGSALTALNGTQVTSGTIADARIDNALARDSELLSVSNALSGQIDSQSSALTGTITTTSNGLSDRLIATNGVLVTLVTDSSNGLSGRLVSTNAALVSLVTTSSNGLQSGIDAEGTARAALVTKLETGNNTFAGSNHFSGIATLTNVNNVLAGNGSALTALNGTQVTSGTIADARIDSTLARDSELLSVSNALSGQIGSQSSALTGTITTTSNGLSDRLIATNGTLVTLVTDSSNGLSGRLVSTNAALVSLVTTSSNGLQSGIDAEGTARAALVTKLETGNNTFAGSNHFSGIATLTNVNNLLAGNGAALTALNGSQITSGTLSDVRLSGNVPLLNAATLDFTGSASFAGLTAGGAGLTNLNASELTSGIVPEGRLSGNLTRLDGTNVFTGTNRFANEVVITNAGNLIAGDGSALTELNAANVASGTLSDSRLSGNVPLLNAGTLDFTGSASFAGLTASGAALTNLNASELTSGVVAEGRLSSNVTRLDGTNVFSGTNRFAGEVLLTNAGNIIAGDGSSLSSLNASQLSSGAVPDGRLSSNVARLDGINVFAGTNRFANEVILTNVGNTIVGSVSGTFTGNGSGLTNIPVALLTGTLTSGQLTGTYSQNLTLAGQNVHTDSNHFSGIVTLTNVGNTIAGNGANLTGLWRTAGNEGTTPGTDFIGTTDNNALVFKVNDSQIGRLIPAPDEGAPNIVFGASNNSIDAAAFGATIGGGGATSSGIFEGAAPNEAKSSYATVGGGLRNVVDINSGYSTIGGGLSITVGPNANYATIAGGRSNEATNHYGMVPGGHLNRAGGQYSFAAGRQAKADADGAFVWADSQTSDFQTTIADSFNVRAQGGLNLQAGSANLSFTGGLLLYNGSEVLTNGSSAALTANNTFSGANVFSGSNHYSGIVTLTNQANTMAGNGAALTGLNAGALASGTIDDARLGSNVALTTNSVTFSGTVGGAALNIGSGHTLSGIGSSIGGGLANTINATATNAFIGAGTNNNVSGNGVDTYGHNSAIVAGANNTVTNSEYALIGAGVQNTIEGADYSVIVGGSGHTIGSGNSYNFIGGGEGHSFNAGLHSAIVGGQSNSFGGEAEFGFVGGGAFNSGSGSGSFLGAGRSNSVEGADSFLGGGLRNTVSSTYSALVGGISNTVSGTRSVIGGGELNALVNTANRSVIAGGSGNGITNADYATISGGQNNSIAGTANQAVIAGGTGNTIASGASTATIGGGNLNAIGASATSSTISGGVGNGISGSSFMSFVGGGVNNYLDGGSRSVIAGGSQHGMTNANYAFIGSGDENIVTADYATLTGGRNNTIGAQYGFVGAGAYNTVSGLFGAIPAGISNSVTGAYGFAAGRNAKALHQGAFVWADSTTEDFASEGNDEFRVRAYGGAYIVTGAQGGPGLYVDGSPVGGQVSDRNKKKNFEALDTEEVLEKLASLEITRWNYKREPDDSVKHMGPMLQDFKPAFYPGREIGETITWQEMHGVELAAIHGLNVKLERKVVEKTQEIETLRDELAQLRALVMEMRKNQTQ